MNIDELDGSRLMLYLVAGNIFLGFLVQVLRPSIKASIEAWSAFLTFGLVASLGFLLIRSSMYRVPSPGWTSTWLSQAPYFNLVTLAFQETPLSLWISFICALLTGLFWYSYWAKNPGVDTSGGALLVAVSSVVGGVYSENLWLTSLFYALFTMAVWKFLVSTEGKQEKGHTEFLLEGAFVTALFFVSAAIKGSGKIQNEMVIAGIHLLAVCAAVKAVPFCFSVLATRRPRRLISSWLAEEMAAFLAVLSFRLINPVGLSNEFVLISEIVLGIFSLLTLTTAWTQGRLFDSARLLRASNYLVATLYFILGNKTLGFGWLVLALAVNTLVALALTSPERDGAIRRTHRRFFLIGALGLAAGVPGFIGFGSWMLSVKLILPGNSIAIVPLLVLFGNSVLLSTIFWTGFNGAIATKRIEKESDTPVSWFLGAIVTVLATVAVVWNGSFFGSGFFGEPDQWIPRAHSVLGFLDTQPQEVDGLEYLLMSVSGVFVVSMLLGYFLRKSTVDKGLPLYFSVKVEKGFYHLAQEGFFVSKLISRLNSRIVQNEQKRHVAVQSFIWDRLLTRGGALAVESFSSLERGLNEGVVKRGEKLAAGAVTAMSLFLKKSQKGNVQAYIIFLVGVVGLLLIHLLWIKR